MDNSEATANIFLSVFQNQFMYLHKSFRKFYVWWQHCAVLHISELKSLALLKAAVSMWCQLLLAMDQERLTASFLWVDVRTLIKFICCWVKVLQGCYKSLNEWLGTQIPSYETVCRWPKAIKNDRKETAVQLQQWQWMNTTWNKWNVFERTDNIANMANATKVGIFPASVYHILTNSLREKKVCTKWISQVLDND
jgi:hypothetical protein